MTRSIQYTRQTLGKNVYEAAQERMAALFDTYPIISVGFSGGKDSTAVLQMALAEARRRRQVLDVIFSDEEAVDPDTEAYVLEVASWPDVRMHWCCAPVQHTLQGQARCFWTCWDPAEQSTWVRDYPTHARAPDASWTVGMSLSELPALLGLGSRDEHCHLVGVRAAESFNRLRGILTTGGYVQTRQGYMYAKPIYDWHTTDLWQIVRLHKWRYSAYYDKMYRLGLAREHQRVAPIGNVASLSRMHAWPELYPDFWNRVISRLPELDAMARYSKTKLYRKGIGKPSGWTWQEWTLHLLDTMQDEQMQAWFCRELARTIKRWSRFHSMPFPETPLRTVDGKSDQLMSWQRFAMMIGKHDHIEGRSRDLM
jgi:predicted phosphoadenosine phosphosulfate sulfurtransferase